MGRLQRIAGVFGVSAILALAVTGCVVYEPPPPAVYNPLPSTPFDRSWSAVLGAFADEGVQLIQQDRATGTARGHVGDVDVTAAVRQRTDGSVQVEFGVSGNIAANPTVKDRIVGRYNSRMGR